MLAKRMFLQTADMLTFLYVATLSSIFNVMLSLKPSIWLGLEKDHVLG